MKQSWVSVHLETILQNVIGLLISFIVMKAYGVSTETTLLVQITIFICSYIRSYLIRSYFNKRLERLNESVN